jgi:hypothetical protein
MSWARLHKSKGSSDVRHTLLLESGLALIVPPRILIGADRYGEVHELLSLLEEQTQEIATFGGPLNYGPDSHIETGTALKNWLKLHTSHPHADIEQAVDRYSALQMRPRAESPAPAQKPGASR